MDKFCDAQEWDIWHNHPGWSFNRKHAAQKQVKAMRMAAMKIRWNAGQFNRRADFVRNTGCSAAVAASMFPASV
jgi:hypothetical protein